MLQLHMLYGDDYSGSGGRSIPASAVLTEVDIVTFNESRLYEKLLGLNKLEREEPENEM